MCCLALDVSLFDGLPRIPDTAQPAVENGRDDIANREVHYEYMLRDPCTSSGIF